MNVAGRIQMAAAVVTAVLVSAGTAAADSGITVVRDRPEGFAPTITVVRDRPEVSYPAITVVRDRPEVSYPAITVVRDRPEGISTVDKGRAAIAYFRANESRGLSQPSDGSGGVSDDGSGLVGPSDDGLGSQAWVLLGATSLLVVLVAGAGVLVSRMIRRRPLAH